MAHLLNATRFKSPSTAVSSFNVTVPSTTAGAKLVCISGGGAIVTAHLGVGGTSFTKRTQSLNSREVAAQDITDSGGGTTTIQITLNGPENVDGCIYEFAPGALGNFIAGAKEGGTDGNTSVDSEGRVKTDSITTTGASVVFAMFTAGNPGTPGPTEKFFNFQPLGKQYANEFIMTDASKTHYWTMIAVSDQASAGTFNAQTSRWTTSSEHQSCVWAYQDLTPGTPTYAPYANAIAAENSLPGSLYSFWFGNATNGNIAGYTDSMSYAPGDTVNFKVDSLNNAFTVSIYRTGFYGYTIFGARRITAVSGSAVVQPAPTVNSFGGTECAWTTNATWTIPANATPGIYFYNMAYGPNIAQGIFIVRSPVPASRQTKIMVTPADFTWQAYNLWGATSDFGNSASGYTGRSIYAKAPTGNNTTRAFAVSYDRPMGTVGSNSGTYYWDSEMALVNFLEGNGYDIGYYSMVDLEKNPVIPSRHSIAVSMGHSEYWTDNLRDAYENARDSGTHLIMVTSNTSLWRVRFAAGDTNKRNMICYKDSLDLAGYDGTTKYDPVTYTGTWRDARTNPGGVNNTVRRPESGMTGQWFVGNGTFEDTVVVPSTYRTSPVWRNTPAGSNATITVRGTSTAVLNTPGKTITINQPAGTQLGDFIVVAVTFTGNPGILNNTNAPLRYVRSTTISNSETMALFAGYAVSAGTGGIAVDWQSGSSVNASAVMTVYTNAVWEDTGTSVVADTGGSTVHTTRSITNGGANRWAVCVFGDCDTTGSSKTTTWTPGAGLTSRVSANNAAGGGPWCSAAIMDTAGAVTQGAHQYSATAEFGNPRAFAGIIYMSPGVPLSYKSLGLEWDYVKAEEPSTPQNLVFLSQQAVPLRGQAAQYSGASYSENGLFKYGLTLYRAASGALVFCSGSWRITYGLSRFHRGITDLTENVDTTSQQMFLNLLCDMGMTPTTLIDTTANSATTALVDPSPAATPADYGFPVTAPTTYQNIFKTAAPQNYTSNDGVDYNLGTVFTAGVNGKVYGVRWHFPGTLPDAPVIGLLYSWTSNTTGTELARVTFTNVQSGWNQALFSSPVSIVGGAKYVVSIWTQDFYVSSGSTFASSGITSGDLTAPADTASVHNGKFLGSNGSPTYPTGSFTSNSYLTDVLFIGSGFEGWGLPIT